jgi:hypothetical protein
MSYRTLFEGYAIHNSNRGLQITHDMYSNGYFMVLFYLAPERGTSESHTSLHENSNIRIEMQTITGIDHLPAVPQYDSAVPINFSRKVTTNF